VNSKSGKTFPTLNPCTAEKIVDIAEGDKVKCVSFLIDLKLETGIPLQNIRLQFQLMIFNQLNYKANSIKLLAFNNT
jgi:hypothetical protein